MNSTLSPPSMLLRPPQQVVMGRGMAFAVAAHALLLIALSLNVQWHSKTPDAFEAELWSSVPQAAAPAAVEPEPEPPKPVVQEKPQPPQPSAEEVQAQRDADIAIAKAKKRADDLKEAQRVAEIKEQQRKDKLEREKLEKDKADKAEKAEKAKLEKRQKDKDAKLARDAEARQENARKDALKRLQGLAGASGGPTATGTALQSAAPSAGYAGRIKARIRPNIVFTDTPTGNPVAEVEVRVAPDGMIIARKIIKPSGDAEWDKAVLRAVDKTETLPRDIDGRVPSVIVITFQPRE